MDLYTRADLPYLRATLKARLLRGDIGILPTDTIYGLSGNALDPSVVARLLRLKGRRRPMSFIPHAADWARLLMPAEALQTFDTYWSQYQGPYTMLLPYGGRRAEITEALRTTGLVGLRQPQHWIRDLARDSGIPLVTTSANLSQEPYMTSLEDLSDSLRNRIDFMVYEGPLPGPPSTLVHLYEPPIRLEARL